MPIDIEHLRAEELKFRQDQFATLLKNVTPQQLKGLRFCHLCGGDDYQWTDWTMTPIDMNLFNKDDDPYDYQIYLLDSICQACDGTGFDGGSWRLEKEDWIALSQSYSK